MDRQDLNNAIGVDLSEKEALIVMSELSAVETDGELFKKVKEYSTLGLAIMRSAYVSYLYVQKHERNVRAIGKAVNSISDHLSMVVYNKYSLGKYVIYGQTAYHKKQRTVIAARLIAAIYRTNGYLFAYEFLKPFFDVPPKLNERQFKTVVQEYAQGRKLSYSYSIVQVEGPQHTPQFTAELVVGNKRTRGTGTSKKDAEANAAANFVRRNHITTKSDLKAMTTTRRAPTRRNRDIVSKQRRAELGELRAELGISRESATDEQLHEALTHRSFSEAMPGCISSECLHIVGAYALDALSFDYMDAFIEPNSSNGNTKRDFLLTEGHLAAAVPSSIIGHLRAGKALAKNSTTIQNRLKVDIAKCVLGSIIANCCETQEIRLETSAREYAYRLFSNGRLDPSSYYRSALQEIVQRYDLQYIESFEEAPGSVRHKPIYQAVVTITGNGWSIRSDNYGASHKAARNRALRTIVTSISKHYPNDETVKELFSLVQPEMQAVEEKAVSSATSSESLKPTEASRKTASNSSPHSNEKLSPNAKPEDNVEAKISAKIEDVLYGNPDDRQDVNESDATSSLPERTSPKQEMRENIQCIDQPSTKQEGQHTTRDVGQQNVLNSRHKQFEELTFTGPERVLHICKGTRACRDRGHNIVCVTALFTTFSGMQIRVNVNYCNDCDIYFLGYREYCFYRDRYGSILGNYVFDYQSNDFGGWGYDSLAKESVLMMYGYTVSQAQDLSPKQRRLILANLMDRGICSKSRIIDYLQFFIAQRENRWNMQLACSKWWDDLCWVRNYRINEQRHFNVAAVRSFY